MFTFFFREMRRLRRDMVYWGALTIQVILSMLVVIATAPSGLSGLNYYNTIGFLASFIAAMLISGHWNNDLSDDALNPLITTPLSPVSIVAGEYLAAMVAVLIPLAIAQIFIVSTDTGDQYYFCGLLPLDAATLLTSAALFTASASQSKKRGAVGAVLPAIFLLFILINVRTQVFFIPQTVNDSSQALFIAVLILMIIPLLLAVAIAAVSAPGSDRAIPVRIAMLLTMAAYIIVIYAEGSLLSSQTLWDFSAAICLIGAVISIFAAVAERRTQSPRVIAAIRNTPAHLRPLRILFSSGAITEMILSLVLAAPAIINDICSGSYASLQVYSMFLYASSLALFVACVIQLSGGKKLDVGIAYFIFLPVLFIEFWVVIKFMDAESMRTVFATIITVLSLAMLIPVACLFLKSLKRE